MCFLFEEKLTNGKYSSHCGHKLPVLNHSACSVVVVAIIFIIALCLDTPRGYSTQKPFEKGTNEAASSEIAPAVAESKTEDTKKRIKISEGAENEHTA